jgi:hypothetical protein
MRKEQARTSASSSSPRPLAASAGLRLRLRSIRLEPVGAGLDAAAGGGVAQVSMVELTS